MKAIEDYVTRQSAAHRARSDLGAGNDRAKPQLKGFVFEPNAFRRPSKYQQALPCVECSSIARLPARIRMSPIWPSLGYSKDSVIGPVTVRISVFKTLLAGDDDQQRMLRRRYDSTLLLAAKGLRTWMSRRRLYTRAISRPQRIVPPSSELRTNFHFLPNSASNL